MPLGETDLILVISPHFTRFVYESVKGSSETPSGGPLIVTTMRKHPVWDKRARLSIRAIALMEVSLFDMQKTKEVSNMLMNPLPIR